MRGRSRSGPGKTVRNTRRPGGAGGAGPAGATGLAGTPDSSSHTATGDRLLLQPRGRVCPQRQLRRRRALEPFWGQLPGQPPPPPGTPSWLHPRPQTPALRAAPPSPHGSPQDLPPRAGGGRRREGGGKEQGEESRASRGLGSGRPPPAPAPQLPAPPPGPQGRVAAPCGAPLTDGRPSAPTGRPAPAPRPGARLPAAATACWLPPPYLLPAAAALFLLLPLLSPPLAAASPLHLTRPLAAACPALNPTRRPPPLSGLPAPAPALFTPPTPPFGASTLPPPGSIPRLLPLLPGLPRVLRSPSPHACTRYPPAQPTTEFAPRRSRLDRPPPLRPGSQGASLVSRAPSRRLAGPRWFLGEWTSLSSDKPLGFGRSAGCDLLFASPPDLLK